MAIALAVAAPAMARSTDLSTGDRALLELYARDTWRSMEAFGAAGELPADALRLEGSTWTATGLTSPTNIAAYLWSTVAAEKLHLISSDEAGQRLGKTLAALSRLDRSHGFFYNWYDPATGSVARIWPGGGALRPFLSSVDNGWLAAALMIVSNARPELREVATALLKPMDFGFFYDPFDPTDPVGHPGLLRGGYFTDNNSYAGFHYGMLNTEPRIASYIGIARKQIPVDHYFRMSRGGAAQSPHPTRSYEGVPVVEGSRCFHGMRIVPTWDGTMFEALMVSLFVPEADWAPSSWGINHPLYVRAQIEDGMKGSRLGYWGVSAACDPHGGYDAYGISALGSQESRPRKRDGVVTPHASFLALSFALPEAMANLQALARNFPVYGSYGFFDSVDVRTGKVSDRVLVLDQGMILAAIANVLEGDALKHDFCAGDVEAGVRPMIAQEHFEAGLHEADCLLADHQKAFAATGATVEPVMPAPVVGVPVVTVSSTTPVVAISSTPPVVEQPLVAVASAAVPVSPIASPAPVVERPMVAVASAASPAPASPPPTAAVAERDPPAAKTWRQDRPSAVPPKPGPGPQRSAPEPSQVAVGATN